MTELRLDPRNARKHSDRNKRQIKQSLETVGAGRSILADADGIVRAGNGVFAEWGDKPVKIVETDGKELVVVQRTDLRGQDAIRAAALDNLVADSSAFDYDAAILAEIARDDDVIRTIANEDAKLQALLNAGVMPTNNDWVSAFEAGGNTANVDGLHTVSFTLQSEDMALLRAHLKKFSSNHNEALIEWLKSSL